jgi:hypothetical protein
MTARGTKIDQNDREIITGLAEIPEGWASAVQVSWECANENPEQRRAVRAVLAWLVREDVLDGLTVRHATHPLDCVYIDRRSLRWYLGEHPA